MAIRRKEGMQICEINQYRTGVGKKLFHYNLIDTSKRAITDNAIKIKASLHAKICTHGGAVYGA